MRQIHIGVIVNTHGLQGDVKVKSVTDFPEIRFQKGNEVCLQWKGEQRILCIERIRQANNVYLMKFEGYDHINMVEDWKGAILTIDEGDLHTLEEDEAYFFELQDSEVYDMQEHYLGKVIEVIETGANAILRVQVADKQVLIPFVSVFVKEFDKINKKMKVDIHRLEGLL